MKLFNSMIFALHVVLFISEIEAIKYFFDLEVRLLVDRLGGAFNKEHQWRGTAPTGL